jgi:hypothetical protein
LTFDDLNVMRTLMRLQGDSDLSTQLVNAPHILNTLGALNLISIKNRDFPLVKHDDVFALEKMKILKYPGSFRASLSQVNGINQDALRFVHTSIESINMQQPQLQQMVKGINLTENSPMKTIVCAEA